MSRPAKEMSPEMKKTFFVALIGEAVCITGGVGAWLYTDKLTWLGIGLVASLGFSIPFIIRLIRSAKGD